MRLTKHPKNVPKRDHNVTTRPLDKRSVNLSANKKTLPEPPGGQIFGGHSPEDYTGLYKLQTPGPPVEIYWGI